MRVSTGLRRAMTSVLGGMAFLGAGLAAGAAAAAGPSVYGDWQSDAPGVVHHIAAADLPLPYATRSVGNPPQVVARPAGAALHVPPGFTVGEFARGLDDPRFIIAAPNGDLFVAESAPGRIRVLRAAAGAAQQVATFAGGLDKPFGIAFFPAGPDPRFVYVAETDRVVRFPYRPGDLRASGPAETIVPVLPSGGEHWTRDIVFSPDDSRMFVSVGSSSNDGEGAAERRRADVLVFTPTGTDERVFAAGLRNCVTMAFAPGTQNLWCATNERDGLGDDLPPDYVTRVPQGAFFGWPWFYTGDHPDPRHNGEHPELAQRVRIPDVLLQPHSAPLEMAFYTATQFPRAYDGAAFVALHGSWNRTRRTGYKVVRVLMKDGEPTGTYEDFLTGFVVDNDSVWGRPVGVAVAADGALFVSEDGNGTIWRIAYGGK